MLQILRYLYSLTAYLLSMASITYLMGFITGIGVPISIVSGGEPAGLGDAVLINSALVLAYGLIHSVMARPRFKRWLTKFVPASLERSTYLYVTTVTTVALVLFWIPVPITLWHFQEPWQVMAIGAGFLTMWGVMVAATFHFGHFEFFGLGEIVERLQRTPPAGTQFTARYLYALVRHPISLGWLMTPWLVPQFTVGHLIFAVNVAIYIFIATYFEERDLIAEFGSTYRRYREQVPAFFPWPRSRTALTGVPEHE